MTKQEKLNEIKRWFHISKESEKENKKTKPHDFYAQGFEAGEQYAYIQVIELLMTKKERKNMCEWLWDTGEV